MNEIKSLDNKIIVKPYSPNLGAVVTGINLSNPISSNDLICIKNMFNKFQVLFFQEQSEISPENHVALGKDFGPLHVHPAAPKMKGYPEIFEIQ